MLLGRLTNAVGICFAVIALSGIAQASTIVDIDSAVQGCSQCSGVAEVTPGTFLTDIYTLVQLTLGPGTYTITNAATTGYYSAWNFQGYPSSTNWVWSFVMAADNGTNDQGTVILDDNIGGTYATQADAAGATGISTYDDLTVLSGTSTAGFVDSFTLSSTTTLDFLIDDYDLSDNGGGVALDITQVGGTPEPSSFVPLGLALLGLAALRLRGRALWTS